MRIVLTTLTISFFYALTATVISITKWTFGDITYSFVMTFGFIIVPLFMCVCVFHFLLHVYRRTKRQPTLIIQILTLCFLYNLTLLLINLPDFFRHQNNAGYIRYKSFAKYFTTNMSEGFITATIFAILIPLIDNIFKNRFIKLNTQKKY
jgi:cytochrome c biogenesis protein CcdA